MAQQVHAVTALQVAEYVTKVTAHPEAAAHR